LSRPLRRLSLFIIRGNFKIAKMSRKLLMVAGAHTDDIKLCYGATMFKYHETFGYDIVYVQSTNNN